MAGLPRVLHVIDSLRRGGAETLLVALVRELGRSKRTWNAVCAPASPDADPNLVAELNAVADGFCWLPEVPLYDPSLATALWREFSRFEPSVVHSHLSTASIATRPVALARRVPHMATVHTMPGPAAEDTRLRAAVDGWSAWLSRAIVAPSLEMADAYRRAYRLPAGRLSVIPNAPAAVPPGPEYDREGLRRAMGADGDGDLIVAVARLQPEKGLADLVDAVALVSRRKDTVRLAIVGSGPEKGALSQQVERVGLTGKVRLLGTRSDVGALLAAADAFCLPSHHEGLPLSLLEAMQSGLPCVATRVGGIPGMIDDGVDGLLVEPGSADDLASALERVLDDDELARGLGARATETVERRYGLPVVADAYARIYERLAGR